MFVWNFFYVLDYSGSFDMHIEKSLNFFFSKVLWGSERYGLVLFFLFFYTWPKGRRLMKKIGSQVAEYSKYGLTPPPSNYEKNIQIRTCFCRKNVLFIFISLENCIYSETLFNWSFSLEEVHKKYGENKIFSFLSRTFFLNVSALPDSWCHFICYQSY